MTNSQDWAEGKVRDHLANAANWPKGKISGNVSFALSVAPLPQDGFNDWVVFTSNPKSRGYRVDPQGNVSIYEGTIVEPRPGRWKRD